MPYFNKTVFREPVFSLYIKVDKVIDNVLSQIEKKTVQTLIRTLPESNLVWLYTLAVWSGSALFAMTSLSQNFECLWYTDKTY